MKTIEKSYKYNETSGELEFAVMLIAVGSEYIVRVFNAVSQEETDITLSSHTEATRCYNRKKANPV